jgi:hypothetical protein
VNDVATQVIRSGEFVMNRTVALAVLAAFSLTGVASAQTEGAAAGAAVGGAAGAAVGGPVGAAVGAGAGAAAGSATSQPDQKNVVIEKRTDCSTTTTQRTDVTGSTTTQQKTEC